MVLWIEVFEAPKGQSCRIIKNILKTDDNKLKIRTFDSLPPDFFLFFD